MVIDVMQTLIDILSKIRLCLLLTKIASKDDLTIFEKINSHSMQVIHDKRKHKWTVDIKAAVLLKRY